MTIPFLIQILFAFFLVDMFIITFWFGIELVDEIRKRIKETPEEEDGGQRTEVGVQRAITTSPRPSPPRVERVAAHGEDRL